MNEKRVDQERLVPVIDEEVIVDKRVVTTGSVRVQKYVDQRVEHVAMPLMKETVDVRRVAVGRAVEFRPEIRTEGDTTIIPVVEEELVVTKRLILKEEIILTKRMVREDGSQNVTLENERADVVRLDTHGRVTGSGDPDKSRRKIDFRRGRGL